MEICHLKINGRIIIVEGSVSVDCLIEIGVKLGAREDKHFLWESFTHLFENREPIF